MKRLSALPPYSGTDEPKNGNIDRLNLHLNTPIASDKRSSNDRLTKSTSQAIQSGGGPFLTDAAFKENTIRVNLGTRTSSFRLPSLLLPPHPIVQSSQTLSEVDVLTCQTIEIFSTSYEEFGSFEHVTEGGVASEIGQIGLRCVYCGKSPFAKAELSVTFPGCLNSMSACVLRMAALHFPKCKVLPKPIQERFQSFRTSAFVGSEKSSCLGTFCLDIGKELGLCNRQPYMSGVILSKASSSIETPNTPFPLPLSSKSMSRESTFGRSALRPMGGLRNQSDDLFLIVSTAKDTKSVESRELNFFHSDHKCFSSHPVNNTSLEKIRGEWNELPKVSSHWNNVELPTPVNFERCFSPSPSKRFKSSDMESPLTGAIDIPYTIWEDPIQTMPCPQEVGANDMSRDSISVLEQNASLHPFVQIQKDDKESLGTFYFYAMKQFQPCTFTAEEFQKRRTGNRDVGSDLEYVGLQCIHCVRKKYLWMGKNSFKACLTRLSRHALKCATSPKPVRDALAVLNETSKMLNETGVQKKTGRCTVLFRLWDTLVQKGVEQPNMSLLPKEPTNLVPENSDAQNLANHTHRISSQQSSRPGIAENTDHALLFPEDRDLLTPFVFRVMNFLERCTFTPDQDTRRSETPIGFAGLRCISCAKRCFYWTSSARFTNSFSDVTKHVRTCPQLSSETRTKLNELSEMHHNDMRTLPRGAQAVFFRRLWTRLHGPDDIQSKFKPSSASNISMTVNHIIQAHDDATLVQLKDESPVNPKSVPNISVKVIQNEIQVDDDTVNADSQGHDSDGNLDSNDESTSNPKSVSTSSVQAQQGEIQVQHDTNHAHLIGHDSDGNHVESSVKQNSVSIHGSSVLVTQECSV